MIRMIFILIFYCLKIIPYLFVVPYLCVCALLINLRRLLVRISS